MKYLLDTNVISEVVKPKPNKNVINWMTDIPNNFFYLSILTIGEIRTEVEKLHDKRKKQNLILWLEHELPEMFESRILPINFEVADRWGRLKAESKKPIAAIDSLIAATALHYDIALVTRNISDFENYTNLELINPWESY